jgi:hypothetical protein
MGDFGLGSFLLNAFTGWPVSRIEYSSQEAKAKSHQDLFQRNLQL